MIRNLKALGIAFVAVFATSAVAVSAAHATATHFQTNGGTGTATITVEQHPDVVAQTFKTKAGNVLCEKFSAMATEATATSPTATLKEMKYSECELGGLAATVNFEAKAGTPCDYTLSSGNTVVAGKSHRISYPRTGRVRSHYQNAQMRRDG